jgi:hypothetical protein
LCTTTDVYFPAVLGNAIPAFLLDVAHNHSPCKTLRLPVKIRQDVLSISKRIA